MRLQCLGPSVPQLVLVPLSPASAPLVLDSLSSLAALSLRLAWPPASTHRLAPGPRGSVRLRLVLPPGYTPRDTHTKYPLLLSL